MFKKLLKYDLASVGRIWWILGISIILVMIAESFVFRICLEILMSSTDEGTIVIAAMSLMLAYTLGIFVISATAIATEVFVYFRFYKHLYTDEGYLTFTLPVSRKKILLSKTVNAMVGIFAEIVAIFIGLLIAMLIMPPAEDGGALINTTVFRALEEFFFQSLIALEGWFFVYVAEAILLFVLTLLASISLVHFCITVGAVIVKKLKLLAGIGIYYAVSSVVGGIIYIFALSGTLFMVAGFVDYLTAAPQGIICASIAVIVLILCAMVASFAAIFYFATLNLLERKLNLA